MIIFLKNIPPDSNKVDIAGFVDKAYSDYYLDESYTQVSIDDVEILSIQDIESKTSEKHGLVRVYPNEVANRVIKILDGTLFKQNIISAREYVNRSANNDPRRKNPKAEFEFKDRRKSDRRRLPVLNSWQKNPILVHSA